MKRHMAIWCITVGVVVSHPLMGTADDQGSIKHSVVKESQGGQVVHTATYQPPRKGAPEGRRNPWNEQECAGH